MQKLRLLLALGEKETATNDASEAYASYQTLLRDFPDYADKLTVLRKLASLAQKLNKPSEAERFEAEIKKLSPATK
jgi:sulfur transfer protein SufE